LKSKPEKLAPVDGSFSATQLKIILAAEKLFASTSIESASLREIASAAEQRNHYAVQYHFGSRDGLVRAVFAHRMFQMEERRGAMLAEIERTGRLHEARALLEVLFLPQLELQKADGNRSYGSFLCQYLLRERWAAYGDFGIPSPPNLDRLLTLIKERFDHLPEAVAQRRIVSGSLVFLSILATYVDEHGEERTLEGEESFNEALNDTLMQIEAGLFMPMPPKANVDITRKQAALS